MNNESHNPLKARLQEIDALISDLSNEREEIVGAMSVLNRYMQPQEPQVRKRIRPVAKSSEGVPRPNGIPTIWEMTKEILATSPSECLTIDEIVAAMADTWWPGLHKTQVAPTIYNFAADKDGRLEKPERGKFKLSRKDEGDGGKPTSTHPSPSLFQPDAKGREAGPGGGP